MNVIVVSNVLCFVKLMVLVVRGCLVDSLGVHQPLLRHVLFGCLHLVPETRPPDRMRPCTRAPASRRSRSLRQPQSLLCKLDKSFFDLRILGDVEGRLPRPGDGADVGSVLGEDLYSLEMAPARRGV